MNCKSQTPCSVRHTPREVIEGKLLAALDDGSKVAILASADDLRLLINALEYAPDGWGDKRKGMLAGLRQLHDEAFAPNASRQRAAKEKP